MQEIKTVSSEDKLYHYVFDTRVSSIREPGSIFPPFPMEVLNEEGKVLPFVFYLDLYTGKIGYWEHNIKEGIPYLVLDFRYGEYIAREVWIECPGYTLRKKIVTS